VHHVPMFSAVAVAVTLSAVSPVLAQDSYNEVITVMGGTDARAMAQDWLILPEGGHARAQRQLDDGRGGPRGPQEPP